ncbi:MAG: OmpA family protein [Myxococcales bacterium]|nr:OmpA family protein [Myxococcales bacterium]
MLTVKSPLLARAALASVFALATLGAGAEAEAIPFRRRLSLRAESALGLTVVTPEGYPYDVGFLVVGRLNVLTWGSFFAQFSVIQGVFPSSQAAASLNNNYMAGVRFAPRTVLPEGRLFIDAEAGLAISGFNRRFGFDIGVGWELALNRYFHLGPVLRYAHIVQPDDEPAPEDAHYISVGVSGALYPWPPPNLRSGALVVIGLGRDQDRDYDGVTDDLDQCPAVVEDHDGYLDEDGCPDLDDDNDRLPDSEDRCPRQPETVNNFEDEDGCPDEAPSTRDDVSVEGDRINLRQRVYFATNRVVVPALFMPELVELARYLQAHPEHRRVRVEAHADDRGTRREGFSLSLRRALNVMAFLVSNGVEAERLVALGLGDLRPLDTAHDEVTRTRNRRVEFVIVEGAGANPAAPTPPPEAWRPEDHPLTAPPPPSR